MNVEAYIASGILELYVAGLLSEKENREVHEYANQYPEIQKEILAIEEAVMSLAQRSSPGLPHGFDLVRERIKIDQQTKVVDLRQKDINWSWYVGWAASILLAMGLFWMYTQNQQLQLELETVKIENQTLETQIAEANESLEKSKELLATLRGRNISVIPLGGQEVSPEAYAKVYWNQEAQEVYIDAQGLPEPPDGFVYQVWSLKMSPLTPTSIGLLADFAADDNKVFALNNPNDSEAFGITLEPAGGSETPNLDQLYALGAVSSS